MVFNHSMVRFLSACIILSFFITCLIALLPISEKSNGRKDGEPILTHRPIIASPFLSPVDAAPLPRSNGAQLQTLAVIVPFRDRFDELLQFAPHMTQFLTEQRIPHQIYVINQVDRYRFNRASLINVGYLFTKQKYDYIAMHDVDLLPINQQLKYAYPKQGPFHVASPDLHPKYHYKAFVGGILLVNREHFQAMNGMSNQYWGWGLEDDEFFVRIRDAGLTVERPVNVTTGTANTFLHIHDRAHRKRDTLKCFNQREITRKRDRLTGLDTLKYSIVNTRNVTIDEARVIVVNVKLECDTKATPWCDCESSAK